MKLNLIDKDYVKLNMLRKLSEGFVDVKLICEKVGISYGTYLNIRKADKDWSSRFDKLRKAAKAGRIESLLEKLAQGTEVTEHEETWTEEDEFGNKVLKKKKVKQLPPNERALAMLAKKYDKELAGTEVTHRHEIGITIKDRALTLDERLNILKEDKEEGQVIETTGKVVDK